MSKNPKLSRYVMGYEDHFGMVRVPKGPTGRYGTYVPGKRFIKIYELEPDNEPGDLLAALPTTLSDDEIRTLCAYMRWNCMDIDRRPTEEQLAERVANYWKQKEERQP